MSIILHPVTVNAQESTQITTWVSDLPTLSTINLRNGEEFLSSASMNSSNVQQKPTSTMPSVTITPIFKTAGAGKRKGSYPLKNVKQSGMYQITATSSISLTPERRRSSVASVSRRKSSIATSDDEYRKASRLGHPC